MIHIRLLKLKTNDFSTQLEHTIIPDIESLDDLKIVMTTVGKILAPYTELLKDPTAVAAFTDSTINNWTISDLQSLQLLLNMQGLKLIVTVENNEDKELLPGMVKYLLVDNSSKSLGIIPYGSTINKEKDVAMTPDSLLSVLTEFFSEYNYFDPSKFVNNPIKDSLDNLATSVKLLGVLNPYAMNKLSRMLEVLDKKLIIISLD